MSPHLFSGSIGLSNDTATTEIYTYWHTLPLHDALPIWRSDIGGLPGGSNSGECYRKRPIQAPAIKFWRKLTIARTGVPRISGVPPDRRHTLNVCRSSYKKPLEPPVRQRYLALLSVFASLPAMALTFQTRLESIEWTVEGDKFECRLSQPVTDFGSGEFVRQAGE